MGLFLDIIDLDEQQTEQALSAIYKSIHNHDDDGSVPHESPFIRRLIELFYERGLARLDAVKAEISKWSQGKYHKTGDVPPRPPGTMARWTPAEIDLVKIYLQALPPSAWTIDDHMMMVDFVVQRYLPADELVSEAKWLATRSSLMGRVQANLDNPPSLSQADKIVAALPLTVGAAVAQFPFTPLQQFVLEYGNAKAAEYVTNFSDSVRKEMRAVIMHHTEQKMLGVNGVPGESLQSVLHDTFGKFNRDWRRIAVTEAGNNALAGLIASLPVGTMVKRVEQYANACPHCRKIDGRVMKVVSPADPKKDGDTDIWIGKDNFGRSAAPRKRVGDDLVDRSDDELWWVPAGLMHPHCRGRWVVIDRPQAGDDAEFAGWLNNLLSTKNEAIPEP